MAVTQDPRFGIDVWGAGTDAFPGRVGWDDLLALLTSKAAITSQDVSAAMGVPGIPGRFFWATDTRRLYRDDGAAWTEISPVGGGGPGTDISTPASEGTSRIGARADHAHAVNWMTVVANTSAAPNNTGNTVWWRVTMTGAAYRTVGHGLTPSTLGVKVTESGLYHCSGSWRMEDGNPPYNGKGRRVIGFGASDAPGPQADAQTVVPPPATSPYGTFIIALGLDMYIQAGKTLSLWAYQESGTALNVIGASMTVRQVG